MITIDDGPDPYSRQAVAETYVKDGYDVLLYPEKNDCPAGFSSPLPFAVARSGEDAIIIHILARIELEGNDEIIEVVRRAETKPNVRVDIQFVEQGDDQIPTMEVARVANTTLRQARRLFMQNQKRRGFYLLANEIRRVLQSHMSDDQNGLTWTDLLDRIQMHDMESVDTLLRAIISAPVSSDEELEDLSSHFDRLESLYAALLRYEMEPSRSAAKPATAP